ncbi:MAG TPA: hypothetical protein PLB62_12300 [Candidatus Sumerlaeota bacterium]|nr:hypothetical protein [Candidatus Sumerlaeota bacterium]
MKKKKSFSPPLMILLWCVIILGVILLIANDFNLFLDILFSGYSFLLLVVIFLEFILMKGMDRSRIYRLEIARLKAKRQKDTIFRQDLDDRINSLLTALDEPDGAERIRSGLQEVLDRLHDL